MERLYVLMISTTAVKQSLISILLGALGALALPPIYAFIALVPALSCLYWLVLSASKPRSAFLIGWMFGFGYFLVGLYWVGYAFLVNATQHAIFALPAVIGLCLFLGFWIGMACWCHRMFFRLRFGNVGGVLLFALLWTFFEWVRAWIASGFPWNMVGSIWAFSDTMIQSAAFIGTYGLSLITVFVGCCPAAVLYVSKGAISKRWSPLVTGICVISALWILGVMRLSTADTDFVPNMMLRLVQPNISQVDKWNANLRDGHILRQIDMSINGHDDDNQDFPPSHVIWSETAVPQILSTESRLMEVLGSAAPDGGYLITGVVSDYFDGGSHFQKRYSNSMFVINNLGEVVAAYDKTHLVPFGEYIPFSSYLPFEKLTTGGGQFTKGSERSVIMLPGLDPFIPLICYEIIFPASLWESGERPKWILNITNDAWYGNSSGPYQHFVSARLRAVEEGLPVVRAANTGISGVIDGYGRVIKSLDLGSAGVIDSFLPAPLPSTLYGEYKNIATTVMGLLAILIYLTVSRLKFFLHNHPLKS